MLEPSSAPYVVAVDLGGTLTKVAHAERDGSTSTPRRLPTSRTDGQVSVPWLAEVLAGAVRERPAGRCAGLAVAVPGVVDRGRGVVRAAPNVGWFDLPLRDELESRTGLPVLLAQDVRAGGVAEHRLGAAAGARDALFVALGTGVAAAVFADGALVQADGYAGEVGHLRVAAGGSTPCPCGQTGCLETVASAPGLARRYHALHGGEPVDARTVAGRARRGDPDARTVVALAVDALTEALTACCTLLGSQTVVVGGGLSGSFDLLGPPVAAGLDARLTFQRRPALLPARLGADAGVVGAGLLGWDHLGASDLTRAADPSV